MTRLTAILLALTLAVLAACAPPGGGPNCDLVEIASTPMESRDRLLAVRVGIEGQWATMLVDTGAERTMLTERAAERLRLVRDSRYVTASGGVGGTVRGADARVSGIVIGDVRFPVERVAVARLGDGVPFDGLLGADILMAFDLDIDMPGGRLGIYRVRRCAQSDPPWAEPAVPIQGAAAMRDRMMVPLEVDGLTAVALLDTGAQASLLGQSAARRLGLDERRLAEDPVLRMRGVGSGTTDARIHTFRQVRLGPISAQGMRLAVMPTDVGFGEALVGQDLLHGRRVWLSFPTRRVWVSERPGERLARP